MTDIGNYAQHARFWDWSGHDRAESDEYWYNYAKKYGKRVLIPMCAWGDTGAYMARRGMTVTAFDITPEMVEEGRRHFGGIPGFSIYEGDARDFRFDIEPADFCFCADFGHIHTLDEIKQALAHISRHMRAGGGLVIETGLRTPGEGGEYSPPQTFYPLSQTHPGLKLWKVSEGRTDNAAGRNYITQTFYAEDENGRVESFGHAFYLQGYFREEWLEAFRECGFELVGEYTDREGESWQSGSEGYRIFEAVKSAQP